MSEDLDATLAALDERLRMLEADLAQGPDPRPRQTDPLDQFGVELRRLAHELVAAWDRVVAHERATARTRHTLVLETQADLHALAALERALAAGEGVRDVELRAYAGGHASLTVELS